jgi:hypothetical protein
MSRTLVVGLLLSSSFLAAAGGEPLPQAPMPRVIPIDELVRQLGSEDFAERETAAKRLGAMALDPPPQLLAATKSDDPELQQRAQKIAEAMRRNVAPMRLPRGEAFARRGAVDLFVAATAVWDLKPDDPRLWQPAMSLGHVLLPKGKMTGPRTPSGCPTTLARLDALKRVCNLSFTRQNEVYEYRSQPNDRVPCYQGGVQSAGVTAEGLWYGVVVSRGDVHVKSGIKASVVFVNGNVTADSMSGSVVVCDGDVEVGPLTVTLVIARGNITVRRGALGSTLVAGGKITVHNQELRNLDVGQFNILEEKMANPLSFITFFELSTVGLEVKAADKAVQVSAVAAGKPCDKAGLRAGDTILEVSGKKPTDAESLRRLLRDALAIGDATVKLRRGDKTETAKVVLPE